MPRKKLTPGAALVAQRQKYPGDCIVCGKHWDSSYAGRLFCSDTCRYSASNQRRRDRAEALAIAMAEALATLPEMTPEDEAAWAESFKAKWAAARTATDGDEVLTDQLAEAG